MQDQAENPPGKNPVFFTDVKTGGKESSCALLHKSAQSGGLEAGIAAGHEQQRKTPFARARIARLAEQAAFGYVLGLEQTAGQAKAAHGAPGHESPDMGSIP